MSKYSHQAVGAENAQSSQAKLQALVPRGAEVLDVGCSSGYLGKSLMTVRGAKVWGLEYDASDAKRAREQGYQEVYQGDVENFDWQQLGQQRFDVIIFADVLEHLKTPGAVLGQVKALLKSGGVVLASIPNVAHLSIRLELMNGDFIYEPTGILDDTHLRYFTHATIQQLFKAQGYQIDRFDATVFDLPDDLVEKRLTDIGLEFTKQFKAKVADSAEARVYQYIVRAKPSAKVSSPSKLPPLDKKIVTPYSEIMAAASSRQHQAEALELQTKVLQTENKQLKLAIGNITDSKKWRLLVLAAKLIKPFKRQP